jgi:hypothetical protein
MVWRNDGKSMDVWSEVLAISQAITSLSFEKKLWLREAAG